MPSRMSLETAGLVSPKSSRIYVIFYVSIGSSVFADGCFHLVGDLRRAACLHRVRGSAPLRNSPFSLQKSGMDSKHGDVQAIFSPTSEMGSAHFSIPLGGLKLALILEIPLVAWFDMP